MARTTRDFSGRVVVVTGGASGLGRAVALRFAAAGARIAVLDVDPDALAATQRELDARGVQGIALHCDVTDAPRCAAAIAETADRFGAIDALVANAGISHRSAFADTVPAVIRRVVEVNFFGAVHCTHAALPYLLRRRGCIVAISSVAGFAPLIARTGYAASKHALHGFFDSLRSEVTPQGVDVTLVCPSFVATGIDVHALGADGAPVRHAQVVLGRRASADDVADRIWRAAVRRERLVLPGATARLAWWTSRLAPAFYERQMARRLRAEIERTGRA